MGLLLQKTNIIRDFREDVEEGRAFWPREIWGKYGFDDVKQLYVGAAPPSRSSATLAVSENEKSELGALAVEDRALYALSEMVLDALRHATDALDYLRSLRNQSCFNFCAIPVTMALATLEMCFMNRRVFGDRAGGVGGKVKIRKAAAVSVSRSSAFSDSCALNCILMFVFAFPLDDHALDESSRGRVYHTRLHKEDTCEGCFGGSQFYQVECGVWEGTFLASFCSVLSLFDKFSFFSLVFHLLPRSN